MAIVIACNTLLRISNLHGLCSVCTGTNRLYIYIVMETAIPDSKVHVANMGPTWVLPAPDGPHVGPMNLAIKDLSWVSNLGHILRTEIR